MLVLLITVPLTYIVIGPVSQGICGAIFMLVKALYECGVVGGIIAGALIGRDFLKVFSSLDARYTASMMGIMLEV